MTSADVVETVEGEAAERVSHPHGGLPDAVTVRPRSAGEAAQIADSGAPTFVLGMDEELYHSRPELSASRMKTLLTSPKAFQYGERKESRAFDLGHAVHSRILGVGLPVVRITAHLLSGQYQAVQSAAAKDWVAKAKADGKTPLKPAEYELTVRASDAVLRHPKARALFERPGESEVSMFAPEPRYGIALRGRADRVGEELIDVKTTTKLDTRSLQRVVDDFSYDLSAEVYRLLFELITGQVAPLMTLVFVEKAPPYDVRVVRLGDDWIDAGWSKLERALEMFHRCTESGVWPGVDEGDGGISELPAPGWLVSSLRQAELEAADL